MPRIAAGGGARVTRPQPAGERTSRGRAASDATSLGLATSDVEGLAARREATSTASRRRRAAAERVVTCAEAPCRRAESWNARARSICTLSVSQHVACAPYNVSASRRMRRESGESQRIDILVFIFIIFSQPTLTLWALWAAPKRHRRLKLLISHS